LKKKTSRKSSLLVVFLACLLQAQQVQQVPKEWTPWPIDFIPTVTDPKSSQEKTPWEDRYRHINSLDRRLPGSIEKFPKISMEDFKRRVTDVRKGIYQWGGQRVKEYFIRSMYEEYGEGGKLLLHGKRIKTIGDFCQWIAFGPWDDTMRCIVHYAQDRMWTSDNKWAIDLEKEFSDMMAITWLPTHADESTPDRVTQGRCAHHLFVKRKNQMITRIRDATKRKHFEAIFARLPGARSSKTENTSTSKVPKVMEYIKVYNHISGFSGYIGYCEGHQELNKPKYVYADSPSGSNASDISSCQETPNHLLWPHHTRKLSGENDISVGSTATTMATAGCEEVPNAAAIAIIRALEQTIKEQADMMERRFGRASSELHRCVCACITTVPKFHMSFIYFLSV
jgi:hypothetical protein